MAFLKYEISVVGVDKVRQAMRAVEREAEGSSRRVLRDPTGRGGKGAGGASSAELALNRQRSAALYSQFREKERAARKEELAAAKRVRSEESNATRQARVQEREHARAERNKTRVTEREAKARTRAEMALNRQRSAALYSQFREEERARARASAFATAEGRRGRAEFARTTKGVLAGTASSAASIGRGAIAATGLAGGAIFAASAHSAMARNAMAADLANQLVGREASVGTLAAKKQQVLDVAGATRGFSSVEVMAGMSAFQARAGEGEATMKMAPIMTEMALASNASMEDLGSMYSSIYASIRQGAGGAQKSVDQIIAETEQLGRAFTAMGQIGAVELKDFARITPSIAASALSYAGSQASNVRDIAALAQIAVQVGGADSAEEGATAVGRFGEDLVTNRDAVNEYLGATGSKKIYANKEKTKLRSLPDLLPDLMAATGGNLEKMGAVFNVRSVRAMKGFSAPYQDAYQAAKASGASDDKAKEAGKQAVRKRFAEFSSIEVSKAEQKIKSDARVAESDKMLEARMRELTTAVGDKLLPQIIELIPAIANLVPTFTKAAETFVRAVKWISEAPVEMAFAGLGALFAAEIAKAGIAGIIAKATNRYVAGGGGGGRGGGGAAGGAAAGAMAGGGAGAGGKTTLGGALGAAGIGLAFGSMAYSGISVAGRSGYDDAKEGTDKLMHGLRDSHGADLGGSIVAAEQQLKIIQDEAGMFGKFMDLFGAGPGGEIESAKAMIEQKKAEYSSYQRTGRSPEAEADARARAAQTANGTLFVESGTKFEKAADKLDVAAEKMLQAAGVPKVGINTGNTPTVPSVK